MTVAKEKVGMKETEVSDTIGKLILRNELTYYKHPAERIPYYARNKVEELK